MDTTHMVVVVVVVVVVVTPRTTKKVSVYTTVQHRHVVGLGSTL